MKVWIVEKWYANEGFGIVSIHSSSMGAEAASHEVDVDKGWTWIEISEHEVLD